MPYHCCVPGCKISNSSSMFQIPKDERRREAWIEAICRPDILMNDKNPSHFRVCFIHFDPNTTAANAVPTLYLPEPEYISVRDVGTQEDGIDGIDCKILHDSTMGPVYNLHKVKMTNSTNRQGLNPQPSTSASSSTAWISDYYKTRKDQSVQTVLKRNLTPADIDIVEIDWEEDEETKLSSSGKKFFQALEEELANLEDVIMNSDPNFEGPTKCDSPLSDDIIIKISSDESDSEQSNQTTSKEKLISTNKNKHTEKIIVKKEKSNKTAILSQKKKFVVKKKPLSGKSNNEQGLCTSNFEKESKDVNEILPVNEEELSKLYKSVFKEEFTKMKEMLTKRNTNHEFFKKFRLYCINLYSCAPEAYNMFQKSFSLPSEKRIFDTKFNFPPGINDSFLKLVSKQLNSMPQNAKYIVLCLDEIPLREHMYYDIRNDEIIGFNNVNGIIIGSGKSSRMAFSALIIRIKGCFHIYEQLIGYGLLGSTWNHYPISEWLDSTIRLLNNYGFVVCAVISDQSPNMDKLALAKGVTVTEPTFTVDGKAIPYLFDIAHLMNYVRNALLKWNFQYNDGKVASWKHVQTFYDNQTIRKIKLAPKLTSAHLQPSGSQLNITKLTKDVFSYTVAAGIAAEVESGLQPSNALGTVDFIKIMNDLYDILSSTDAKNPHEHKKPFIGAYYQIKCLSDAFSTFSNIRIFDGITRVENDKLSNCFKGILTTLKGVLKMHRYFKADGIKTFHTNRLHLKSRKLRFELFAKKFSKQNTSLMTPIQFKRCFCQLALKQLLKSPKLINSKTCFGAVYETSGEYGKSEFGLLEKYFPNAPNTSVLSVGTKDYRMAKTFDEACKYIFDKVSATHTCDDFKVYAIATKKAEEQEATVGLRRYIKIVVNYEPSEEFINCLKECKKIFMDEFQCAAMNKNIGLILLDKLQKAVAPIASCSCLPKDYISKLFLRWCIYNRLVTKAKKVLVRQKNRNK